MPLTVSPAVLLLTVCALALLFGALGWWLRGDGRDELRPESATNDSGDDPHREVSDEDTGPLGVQLPAPPLPSWTPPVAQHGRLVPDRPYPPHPLINLELYRWQAPGGKDPGAVTPVGYPDVAGLLGDDGDAYRPVHPDDDHLTGDSDNQHEGETRDGEHDAARGHAAVVAAMPGTVVQLDWIAGVGVGVAFHRDPPPQPDPDPNPWRAVPWLPVQAVAVAVVVHMGLVRYEPHGRHHRTERHDKARPTFGPSTRGRGVRRAVSAGWLPSGGV